MLEVEIQGHLVVIKKDGRFWRNFLGLTSELPDPDVFYAYVWYESLEGECDAET